MNINDLSKLEQIEIKEVLEQFGLNEKDQVVYLALLGMGETTITPLSKKLKHPPTTIQSVLIRLDKRGLLLVGKRKSRHTYLAKDPKAIKQILNRQLEELSSVIPLLNKLKGDTKINSKIRIYYQERMTEVFYKALQSKEKLIYEIVSAKDIQDILGEKLHFTKRRKAGNVNLKSLRVEKNEIKKYNKSIHTQELRKAKFLPQEMDFKANILLWDETVVFFSSKEEGIAVKIESKSITVMIKQIFDLLWSVSRRMETI